MKRIFLAIVLLFTINITLAQSEQKTRKYSLNGYLQMLNLTWIEDFDGDWRTMNTITNRFDFRWFPVSYFNMHIGVRNIMNYGQLVRQFYGLKPFFDYHELLTYDPGYLDLTISWADKPSYLVYTNFDRANISFIYKDFEAVAGRQRINWGLNQVWNPNDIFNTFNYFDFDYIERPGCDAVRLQYYTGFASSAQLAFKIDNDEDITLAGMYKFNKWKYDFQFLGGVMEEDIVVGAGWSGQIEGAGFNGEFSYFHDAKNFSDTTGEIVGSFGINYTFRNSLLIHFAALINSAGTTGPASMGGMFIVRRDISAKNFTLAKHSIFGRLSYPVTPLIRAELASIYNPHDKSVFVGPSVDFSVSQNVSFLILSQLFFGEDGTEFGDYGKFFFFRLKWNF